MTFAIATTGRLLNLRLHRPSRTLSIAMPIILLGTGIALWARLRIESLQRGYIDIHPSAKGDEVEVSMIVYGRSPTAEVELKQDLFGMGVSLLVEGVLVLVISFANAGHTRTGASNGMH